MPILVLPPLPSLLLYTALWIIFQFGAAFIALRIIPDSFYRYDKGIFKPFAFEKNGQIYRRLFRVHRWKKYLPDGAAISKKGYRKKKLPPPQPDNLEKFLLESCRAEMTHLIAIFPFWVFIFIGSPLIVVLMLIYALLINLPCIIAQRYNRPRLARLLSKS